MSGIFEAEVAIGIRLSANDEMLGADLAIHKISANPDTDITR